MWQLVVRWRRCDSDSDCDGIDAVNARHRAVPEMSDEGEDDEEATAAIAAGPSPLPLTLPWSSSHARYRNEVRLVNDDNNDIDGTSMTYSLCTSSCGYECRVADDGDHHHRWITSVTE